ncbi:isocitrate lyase/PEP mutase family protein [Marinicauda algicola]|uniref:isocitrate lyase/PEP mutase family protein n=1 Tax=Marinicauda algicola TaxID=2029849 RepID=UPI0019CFA79F|nr:isocitrate lyase/PEP mutase family protein [Marinicauda algicola]
MLAPGVYDALSALLVEQAGFEAAYLSGASIAYTQLGRPDLGLVTASEVADVIARIRERTGIPLVVDADTGFGNALNVQRTVEMFERAGRAQSRSRTRTCPRLRASRRQEPRLTGGDGRQGARRRRRAQEPGNPHHRRTDAIAVEGFEAALERAEAYLAAGADMLFVEAPRSAEELSAIARRFKSRVPLLANMVEAVGPDEDARPARRAGLRFVITPGAMVRALAFMAREFLSGLKQTGSTAGYRERMLDFDGLNALLGLPEMKEKGARYDADRKDAAE